MKVAKRKITFIYEPNTDKQREAILILLGKNVDFHFFINALGSLAGDTRG